MGEESGLEESIQKLRPNVKRFVNSLHEGLCLQVRETVSILQQKPDLRTHKSSHRLESLLLEDRMDRD